MLFLNPTILFALFAAAIPVIIHMLNLRKLKKVDFSTLKFLKEIQKSKIRKIKLKQWLLLALRVLIILFVIFAFSRPTLKGTALAGTTSASKTSAVFILDDSFSMSFIEENGSLFNQAKLEINKIISSLKEGDDAEVLLLSNSKTDDIKLHKNINYLKKKISNLKVISVSGNLDYAIKKGLNLLSNSDNFNKELYVFSDFQKRNVPDKISKYNNTYKDIRFYAIKFGSDKFKNVGVDNLTLGTQIFEKNKPIIFNTTLTNYSPNKVNDIVLSLFINGERKSQKNINLSSGASTNIEMISDVSSSGFFNAFVEIDDDGILQDNKRFVNFYIPKKINVGLFADNTDDTGFILPALSSGKNKNDINITQAKSNQLASLNLTKFDVIFYIPNKNTDNLNRLQNYIQSGGSVIILPGSTIDGNSFNKILLNLKITANVQALGIKNSNKNYVTFDKVNFQHPVFENLFTKGKKKEIDSPRILYHFKMNIKNHLRQIIKLNDGSSFLSEIKKGQGKIFVFNTAPVLTWSNFPIKGIFAPLLVKSIFYLSSKNISNNNYIAGENVKIKFNNPKRGVIKIVNPNKSVEFLNREDNRNYNYINYNKTDLTGFYQVEANNKVNSVFSINANPNESVQKYLSFKEFEEYLQSSNFKGKYIQIENTANLLTTIQKTRFGSELWKTFIIIALFLAILEMFVSKSSKKDMAELK